MGLFDDAIREHLELKRQKGADEEELKELEDEAFGLPTRPGEPDFPGSTSETEAVAGEAEAGEGKAPSSGAEDQVSVPSLYDAETDEARVSDAPQAEGEDAPATEAPVPPVAEAAAVAPEEPPATAEAEIAAAPTEAEEPAGEPATAETDIGDSPEDEAGSPFSTAEREAIAEQPTVFFEQQQPAELELGDLDLDLDEEIEEVGGAVSEPLPDEQPLIVEEAFADEEVVSSTEVAEPPHEIEPEPTPPAEGPETAALTEEPEDRPPTEEPDDAPPTDEPESAAATSEQPVTDDFVEPAEGEQGTGEDDVLEETPEFLRDNPDDDELWFEQGEPKDFDF